MNVKSFAEPSIGDGIFTIPETATILGIPKSIIARWVRKYWEADFVGKKEFSSKNYTWGDQRNKAFNFYTFVEIIAVHSLRKIGVSFNKIKIAHEQLEKIVNTPYPFAFSRLMTDGNTIFLDYSDYVLVNLKSSLQLSFKKIIEPFCKKLDFNNETQLAQRYWPIGKDFTIVVDPHHCFGQPTIFGTNITTRSIFQLIAAGEEKEAIAEMFSLKLNEVDDAIRYEQRLAA